MNEKMKEAMIQLEKGVREIYADDRYKDYLNIISRLHTYSPANCLLIALQNPDATIVAGFNAWKKMNRFVKKGEHGIRIFCPINIKKEVEENGEKKEIMIPSFKPGYVYDIKQTGGHDVPSYIVELLKGKVENYEQIIKAIINCVPAKVSFEEIDESYNGQYDSSANTIIVKEQMDEIQKIKTLLHETAHCFLHKSDVEEKKERAQKEVEAESVAYAVCCWLGLDTSEYSFKYVAAWSAEQKNSNLKKSLAVISKTASEIIDGIEEYIKMEEVK